MSTCSKCKWWSDKVESNWTDEDPPKPCLNPDLKAYPGCEGGDVYVSGSGIETAPEFGCIQFEPKS